MTDDPNQDERVTRLKTPAECEQFAINVAGRLPELARAAKRRSVELKAAEHGASADVEREALEAVYAYERVLSERRGKTVRASRTWQMIKRHGIIGAVERAVDRKDTTPAYQMLIDLGMQDFAFEAVILRHPTVFSETAIERSRERMEGWASDSEDASS